MAQTWNLAPACERCKEWPAPNVKRVRARLWVEPERGLRPLNCCAIILGHYHAPRQTRTDGHHPLGELTMPEQLARTQLAEIQSAADRLVRAQPEGQPAAFNNLASVILDRFDHKSNHQNASSALFSKELPQRGQHFAATWLVWVLSKSPGALNFQSTEALAGALFDRTLQNHIYGAADIDSGAQTFEKLQALTAYMQLALTEIEDLIRAGPDLNHLNGFREEVMRLINRPPTRYLLSPFLPRTLINKNRLDSLFHGVESYVEDTDTDPIHTHEEACQSCEAFIVEAEQFGTTIATSILGLLGRQLKTAVEVHFEALEAKNTPNLNITTIAKKYPLLRLHERINLKIRITNVGNGPARELRLDELVSDTCLSVETTQIELGTIQPGSSFVVDIQVRVMAPASEARLVVQFSWLRPRGRSEFEQEFTVVAQREDIDWDQVELTEPYSLEAIRTRDELIGREEELKRLLRLTSLQTVGSGFIYGHKRVGKTSLANAVEERLTTGTEIEWVVINKGSGDYVGGDAASTLRSLGDVLAQAMSEKIPALASVPLPDFKNGLAPLSGFVDKALRDKNLSLLFILDEFDELPPDLFKRTDISSSLFQPLRQISNKPGCGFLLVGGENMQRIVNLQGDRLNKFRPIEVDSFDSSDDFVELIRKPVEDWLTINDSALNKLFESSGGNPYFAKLLATELFTHMVQNRYSDASEIDVALAIEHTLHNIGSNSFAHFWTDGLVEASDQIDEQHMIRRSVLIAAGRSFRKHAAVDAQTIWAESGQAVGLPIGEHRFHMTLQDFVRRRIMVEDGEGNITPKIPLFRSWLKGNGVGQLLEDARELDDLRATLQDEERIRVRDEEIADLCEKWQLFHYRGRSVVSATVRRWLDQFDNLKDQRLMLQLLSGLRMYDEHTVRAKMNEAFGIVTRNMRTVIEEGSRVRRDIMVSSLDRSAAKAGMTYCRLFASENQIWSESVNPIRLLERRIREQTDTQRLVIIDDFAGTGRTLVDGLKENLETLKLANAREIRIILVVVVGFGRTRDRLNRFIADNGLEADVYFCDELGDEDKVFSDASSIFLDPQERDRARQVAESKGVVLERRHPLGYGDTQSAVVFYQSCPNNTLPILWSAKSGWSPLFPRL